MTKRLHLLLIVIFLLYSSITFAISDVNCDTPYDRGNLLCVYTGITAWEPYPPYSQLEGDDNPSTQEEQDSFGTAGLYTELDGSGVEVSFGGGAMDWYGESCDDPHVAGNCQGVDVEHVKVDCSNEYQAFDKDPCPDGTCPFLVKRVTTIPRRLTRTRCNFLSTTPLGQYTITSFMIMDYYDAYHKTLYPNALFQRKESFDLGCTNYKGCTGGRTCVSIGEETECWCIDQTGSCQECIKKANDRSCDCDAECMSGNCDGGICKEACQCTSGACCDGCNYFPSTQQPTGKTDVPRGEFYCEGKDRYQYYTDWYCDGTSAEPKSRIAGRFEKTCDNYCWNGACKSYKMKILVVPLRWGRSNQEFTQNFDTQWNVFVRQLGINNCRSAVKQDLVDVKNNFSDFQCVQTQNDIDCQLDTIEDFINQHTTYRTKDYDYVVGIIDVDRFDETNCDGASGCSDTKKVAWAKSTDRNQNYSHAVLAHEVGHFFDLEEQYCSNQAGSTSCDCNDGGDRYGWFCSKDVNPLGANRGCDPRANMGCCLQCSGTNACCEGNRYLANGRSIMSYALVPALSRGFDVPSLDHLETFDKLGCD